MNYWLAMSAILLTGYALVKWSGRTNVQENEGANSLSLGTDLGNVGIRATSKITLTNQAGNYGANEGDNGGEA